MNHQKDIIDIFNGYIIGYIGYIPFSSIGNTKSEILLVKIFSIKQKKNQILPATIEKIKFLLFKKTVYGSFR